MKNSLFLLVIITLLSPSCKEQELEYLYSDKNDFLECTTDINNALYKEALYTFEQDILDYHNAKSSDIISCYVSFLHRTSNNNIDYKDIISSHTLLVLEALKEDTTLWDFESKKSNLNYKSPIIKCISNNIQNKDIKTTFDALLSVNSMDPKLFEPAYAPKYEELINDKYLALYVALDLYYAKLFDIDFSKINTKKSNE
jgi:hypothetical protein